MCFVRRDLASVLLTAFLAFLPGGTPAAASGSSDAGAGPRPRTALVLSGGGARGIAHIGVLRALEELRVPVDLVVGTSMGSLVGGLYAAGYSPEALQDAVLAQDWRDIFDDRPRRQSVPFRRKQDDGLPLFDLEVGIGRGLRVQPGLITGQKLGFLLQVMTLHIESVEHFDDLPLAYRAVATDLRRGGVEVLERGELATAIRASMAVPGVLTPVEVDGSLLVDGGILRNLPVDVARRLGAERIIAVDISTRLDDISKMSMFSVAAQSLSIFSEANVVEQLALLGERDLLITPDLEGVTASSFAGETLRRAIDQGLAAARGEATALAAFAVSEAEWQRYLDRQRAAVGSLPGRPFIAAIEVVGHSRVSPRLVRARFKSRPGSPLDLEELRRDLERVYEIGEFQQVAFHLRPTPDGALLLIVEVEEKDWGPNYLRFGLALESNFRGRGQFTALAQMTRSQLTARGADWKSRVSVGSGNAIFSELYLPLDYRGFLFVAPAFELFDRELSALSAAGDLEQIRLDLAAARLDVGIQFRNVGALRVGVVRGGGSVDVLTQSAVEPFDFHIGGWRAGLAIDRFDSATFPRHGPFLAADLFLSRESMGADQDYDKLELFAAAAGSRGRNTLVAWLDGESNLGSEVPFYERLELGGFLGLSGLEPGAEVGNVGGVLAALYYRQVALLPQAFGRGVYVGGSLEAGGAWDSDSEASLSDLTWAGSAFLGVDTKLGPFYFGYGQAETGDGAFYFFLGRLFS